jgi:hypothetical protein
MNLKKAYPPTIYSVDNAFDVKHHAKDRRLLKRIFKNIDFLIDLCDHNPAYQLMGYISKTFEILTTYSLEVRLRETSASPLSETILYQVSLNDAYHPPLGAPNDLIDPIMEHLKSRGYAFSLPSCNICFLFDFKTRRFTQTTDYLVMTYKNLGYSKLGLFTEQKINSLTSKSIIDDIESGGMLPLVDYSTNEKIAVILKPKDILNLITDYPSMFKKEDINDIKDKSVIMMLKN